jgi:hypothetical protein
VSLLMLFTVAGQATGARVFPRHRLEADNLGYVPATLDVGRARTMTRFTPMCRIKCSFEMRGILELLLIDLLMTRFAGVGPKVFRGFTWLSDSRLFLLSGSEA